MCPKWAPPKINEETSFALEALPKAAQQEANNIMLDTLAGVNYILYTITTNNR